MSDDTNLLSVLSFNRLDDSLFNLVLSEMSHGFVNYDEDCLELLFMIYSH